MSDRGPFDPSRVRREPRDPPAAERLLTPRGVNELIRAAIESRLPSTLHVLGEIGDLARPGSGHLYFALKDDHSELRCVMWRSAATKLKFAPQTGLEVIATGVIEVYAPRGQIQLVVRKLEPRGIGALELALRQLREKLVAEGLFDPARKRSLPFLPRRVAVVTSPRGAAVRDIFKTLHRRAPWVEILLLPVRVQGPGAAVEISAAIDLANRHADALGGIDVLIFGRGGGSLEDLWAFNEEAVVRAVSASRIPTISAVGHEIDWCLSDLAADVRAATPTAAAEIVAPARDDLLRRISSVLARVARETGRRAAEARAELRHRLAADPLARPAGRIREAAQRIDEQEQALRRLLLDRFDQLRRGLDQRRAALDGRAPSVPVARAGEHLRLTLARLPAAAARLLSDRARRLNGRVELLTACDPRRVLRRGYSLTRDARTGRVLRSIRGVRDGQRLEIELSDGKLQATADDPKQPGLFDETLPAT